MTIDLTDATTRADLEAAGYTVGEHPRFGLHIEDGPTCGDCSQIIIPGDEEDHAECGAAEMELTPTELEDAWLAANGD